MSTQFHDHSSNFKFLNGVKILLYNILQNCHLLYVNKERSRTSVDVFSTFLFFSYTKLVVIFISVIEPGVIFNVSNHSTQNVLSSDPSVQWPGLALTVFHI